MPQPPAGASFSRKLKKDLKDLVDDARILWNAGRQPAEDVVTVVQLADIAQRGARRAYLWAAAPVVRLERRLAALEDTAARVDARLSGAVTGPAPLSRAPVQVRTRPTVDRRFQVDVEGRVPDDAQLLFVQDGVERRARVTQSGAGFLRADIGLDELRPGRLAVVLDAEGGRQPLTTVDVGG